MELYGLIGIIVIIAVVCSIFDVNEKFSKLLYILCGVLVVVFLLGVFGFSFGSHMVVRQ